MADTRRQSEALFRDRQGRALDDWISERRSTDPPTAWRRLAIDLDALTDGLVAVAPQTLLNWYGTSESEAGAA